jgi:hypothetical protein
VHHRSCWCVGGDVGACRCRLTKCGCSARRCTAAKLRGGGRDVGRRRERRHNGDFRGLWAIRINRAKASMFDSGSSTWSTFFILIYSKNAYPAGLVATKSDMPWFGLRAHFMAHFGQRNS